MDWGNLKKWCASDELRQVLAAHFSSLWAEDYMLYLSVGRPEKGQEYLERSLRNLYGRVSQAHLSTPKAIPWLVEELHSLLRLPDGATPVPLSKVWKDSFSSSCPECKGTGWYIGLGFLPRSRCSLCG